MSHLASVKVKKIENLSLIAIVLKKRYEGVVDPQLANSLVESGKGFESAQGICQIELERTIKINELNQNTKEKYKLISIEKAELKSKD